MSSDSNSLKYDVLSYECYGFFGRMVRALIPVYLWMLLPPIALGAVAGVLAAAYGVESGEAVKAAVGPVAAMSLTFVIALLVMLLGVYLYTVMLTKGYGVVQSDQSLVKSAWGHARRTYMKVLGAGIVKYLVYYAAMLLLAVIPAILVGFVNNTLGTVVGIVLAVIFGFYLMIRWLYIVPLVAVKESGIIAAFRESSELVKDHWWLVFRTFLLVVFGPAIGFVALSLLVVSFMPAESMVTTGVNLIITLAQYVIMPALNMCFIFVTMKALNQANQPPMMETAPMSEQHDI